MVSIAHTLSVLAIKALGWTISKPRSSNCFNYVTGPGQTWWAKFKKHHVKEITLRKPDKLDRGRSHMANVNVMAQHFNLLKKIMV